MRVQSYTGSEALPITLLFFNLLNVNSTRFVQLTGFRTNACFQLVDHIVVVQTVFAHAIFIEAAFLVAAGDAECRNQRLTRPFTTQPIIETSIGVMISSEALLQRVNRTDNIKFLTRTGRAGDEVDPRERIRSDFKISKPTLISSTGSAASDTRSVSPMPSDSSRPKPMADLTAPLRAPPLR